MSSFLDTAFIDNDELQSNYEQVEAHMASHYENAASLFAIGSDIDSWYLEATMQTPTRHTPTPLMVAPTCTYTNSPIDDVCEVEARRCTYTSPLPHHEASTLHYENNSVSRLSSHLTSMSLSEYAPYYHYADGNYEHDMLDEDMYTEMECRVHAAAYVDTETECDDQSTANFTQTTHMPHDTTVQVSCKHTLKHLMKPLSKFARTLRTKKRVTEQQRVAASTLHRYDPPQRTSSRLECFQHAPCRVTQLSSACVNMSQYAQCDTRVHTQIGDFVTWLV